jgi:TRAP-type transport system small permease protein
MDRFERIFVSVNRWVLIVLLAAMAMIIFANVGLRYLTSQSIEWAEEVARHLMMHCPANWLSRCA